MSWLEDIQNNRKRQVEQMAKAFGYDTSNIQKAEDDGVDYTVNEEPEDETTNKSKDGDAYAGKSDMYKMRMLGLRKFNDQDQKDYIGVEDADNSYITNLDNGDIIISKTDNGYLVSKFPIDENNEGDEQEATDLSEAIKIALRFKEELENDEDEPEQIMYKEETDKAFDDEINPFEREAWEASLSKAELDKFEKAKHADGDMHPNGKWVWRSSANGGKGDWRVASPSKRGGGARKSATELTTSTTQKKEETKTDDKFANMDIKDAKKKLVGKNVTIKEYFFNGKDKYVDATGTIHNVRLYGKNKQPIAEIEFNNGDALTISLKQLDERKAQKYDIILEDDTKKAPNIKTVGVAEMAQALLETARKSKKTHYVDVEVNGRKYKVRATSESIAIYNDKLSVVPRSNQVFSKVLYEAYKDVQAKKDNKPSKSPNSITHDINGTKVTVTKNVDGSYTLEANGKKFKSDDPSFFVNGTNLKPSVKKALAKEVGIEVKTVQTTKVPSGKKISYEDDIVAVYDNKGKKVYEGMLDYSPYQLDDSKWNATDKNYDLPKGYKMVGK